MQHVSITTTNATPTLALATDKYGEVLIFVACSAGGPSYLLALTIRMPHSVNSRHIHMIW